ncbi:DUF6760 family protein [Trinickia dinghuensis]|uniref:DUF6760 family protein n=1 Tax=Trinickia dinghuensis TaxID=2291023 RepID=UPI00319DAF66
MRGRFSHRRNGERPGKHRSVAVPRELYQEIAFIAYHFHWSYADIVEMEHVERRRWCNEISAINEKMNGDTGRAANVGAPIDLRQLV